MKIKNLVSLFTALIILLFTAVPVLAVDDYGDDEEDTGKPHFSLYNKQTYSVKAGEKANLSIIVQNITKSLAKKVNVSFVDDSKSLNIVGNNVTSVSNVKHEGLIYSLITLDVPEYTLAGTYQIKVNIDATGKYGDVVSQSLVVDVVVSNNIIMNALSVSGYSVDKQNLKTGDVFDVTVKVKNSSGIDVKSGRIELTGLDGSKFAMADGLSYQISNFRVNEEKNFTFKVIACAGISSIREAIGVQCTYYLDETDPDSIQKSIGTVTVSCAEKKETTTGNDEKTFAPDIIIQSYNFGGDYAVGGKVFPLLITIKNTGNAYLVKNLKVTVNGAAGPGDKGIAFSPSNSSNTFFFETLSAGATQNISLQMLTRADAKPDSYPITINFEYEYVANGKTEKAEGSTVNITIPVQQDDRFTINSVDLPVECYVGMESNISVTFVNKGKSSVYNVEAEIEGNGISSSSSKLYIGNVDSGAEEYYDAIFTPDNLGDFSGTVIVRYEDSNGNAKEIRQEFTGTAMEMPIYDEPMDYEEVDVNAQGTMPLWLILVIIGGSIAVVVTVIIVVVKVVKKKKALKEIEEDDENY